MTATDSTTADAAPQGGGAASADTRVARERPLLFKPEMVRALLAGTKTQTRRRYKARYPEPYEVLEDGVPWQRGEDGIYHRREEPYGVAGDRLWVREAFAFDVSLDEVAPSNVEPRSGVEWFADGDGNGRRQSFERGKTRVSIHMPRWASRITLEVTDVRVERLQDISEDDARAEGLTCITKDGETFKYGIPDRDGLPGTDDDGWPWQEWEPTARAAYKKLWEKINGPGSWDANPFIWRIAFPTIDRRGGA